MMPQVLRMLHRAGSVLVLVYSWVVGTWGGHLAPNEFAPWCAQRANIVVDASTLKHVLEPSVFGFVDRPFSLRPVVACETFVSSSRPAHLGVRSITCRPGTFRVPRYAVHPRPLGETASRSRLRASMPYRGEKIDKRCKVVDDDS